MGTRRRAGNPSPRRRLPIESQCGGGEGGRGPSRTLRIGTLNVRGCNNARKREEIGRLFESRGMDVMAVNETKLRGRGEVMFGSVAGRMSGVEVGETAKEGVALIVRKEMSECVREWKEVSSRLMWVRMRFGVERWVFVSVYGPGKDRENKEMQEFWIDVEECINGFDRNENVVVLGDMNARVGSVAIPGIIGEFGVDGVNESGERMLEMCNECGMSVGNTYFMKRRVHKYTWHRRVRGEVACEALMDYVVIRKDVRHRLLDVNVLRGAAGDMTDHYLVEGRLKVVPAWIRKKDEGSDREIVKINELEKEEKMREYQERVKEKWNAVRESEWRGVEEEWESLKEAVNESAAEVCGKRRVREQGIRKGSEWWNDRVKKVLREKRQMYERWLQSGRNVEWERYKEKRREAKRVVKQEKRRADERWGEGLTSNFRERKKMFWKEVKRVRGGDSKKEDCVKDVGGEVLVEREQVLGRWGEYFESLLNVTDVRQASIIAVEGGRMPRMRNTNEKIGSREVVAAINRLKAGKASGMDGIAGECIRKGGVAVVEWLVRMFNGCFVSGCVPEDWKSACIVPLYKGKGDRRECGSYRGISLLSVVGKVYGRVLIERVIECTDKAIGEEQCGFRSGRGCIDQIFVVRQICEKMLEKHQDVFWAFMDLEKAYDRIDREALWQVLGVYGVGGCVLKGIQSFYVGSSACVRVGSDMSESFEVTVGLRQGCVMSPWLFNVYMDGVVREVKMRTLGRGLGMRARDGQEWEVSQLLFADDTALVAVTEEKLQRLVQEFGVVCERRKLRVNVGKSKVMVCSRERQRTELSVRLKGEILEEVESFRYLGSKISKNAEISVEVEQRMKEGMATYGAMKSIWKVKEVGMNVKKALYESIIVPTVLYGGETWGLREAESKRLDVMEMKCLRSMCGVTRRDRFENVEIRRRVGIDRPLRVRVEERVLSWFGHMERMNGERMTKKVYESEVGGARRQGRPPKGWRSAVKDALNERRMTVRNARLRCQNRSEWRAVVYGRAGAVA